MLFKVIIAVYYGNNMEHTNILWAECKILDVRTGATYTTH
jgi:hypothetical protein